ncbi:hypothetical protein [Ruegeria arenilitoris]|uniref:hypothetical protein n=1 Tax=Ruegeria arenilitoris TaxID=1173585 RepID=UPI00147DE229|nr:hypothetical protein [Ruegeria arenilitoris]
MKRHPGYRHTKVSGPVKRFIEGTAGVFGVLTLLMLIGGFVNDDFVGHLPAAIFLGVISGVFYGIASLIPSKNRFDEK